METPRLFQISALTHQGTQELVHQINQYLTEKNASKPRKPKRSRQQQIPRLPSNSLKPIQACLSQSEKERVSDDICSTKRLSETILKQD
ncbi:Obg family GTPase CgtA [Neisseria flavescens]|nr:Obg family GTPase CgtA [Neisseria flavescens]